MEAMNLKLIGIARKEFTICINVFLLIPSFKEFVSTLLWCIFGDDAPYYRTTLYDMSCRWFCTAHMHVRMMFVWQNHQSHIIQTHSQQRQYNSTQQSTWKLQYHEAGRYINGAAGVGERQQHFVVSVMVGTYLL